MESLGKQIKSRLDYLVGDDIDLRDQQDCVRFIIDSLIGLSPKQCKQLAFINGYPKHKGLLLDILELNKRVPVRAKKMVKEVLRNGT